MNDKQLSELISKVSASPDVLDALDDYFVYRTERDAGNALFALAGADHAPVDLINHLVGAQA